MCIFSQMFHVEHFRSIIYVYQHFLSSVFHISRFLVHVRFLSDVSRGTLYFALNSFFIKMFHVKQSALPIFSF